MKKTLISFIAGYCLVLFSGCKPGSPDMKQDIITEEYPEEQSMIQKRINEILEVAKSRDIDRLESFHLYGPKFTKFDDMDPLTRQDAEMGKKSERETFTNLQVIDAGVEDLKVDVFGKVAIATFYMNYKGAVGKDTLSGKDRGTFVFVKDGDNWKITHEHFSLLNPAK